MMKKVVWSPRAEIDLYDILTYWIYHNKSAAFSIKLEREIQESIDAICLNPEIGKRTNRENIRLKLVRDFWIVYGIEIDQINILAIFDTRQDDNKLTRKIDIQ